MYPKGSEFRYDIQEFSIHLNDLDARSTPVRVDVSYAGTELIAIWDEFGEQYELRSLSEIDQEIIQAKFAKILRSQQSPTI